MTSYLPSIAHHLSRAAAMAVLLGLACTFAARSAAGQDAQSESSAPSGLSLEQQRLASRFERLEAVAARLAELADESEPERAAQLRRAIKTSREKGVAERFNAIVELLEGERLAAAARDQGELHAELDALLQVLLEDPGDSERDAMKRFLKAQIRELGKLIRQQRSLRSQSEDAADPNRIADTQKEINESAERVEKQLKEGSESPATEGEGQDSQESADSGQSPEGQPSGGQSQDGQQQQGQSQEGESQQGQSQGDPAEQGGQQGEAQPPSDDPIHRAAQRVEQARRAMEQAEEKLRDAEKREATEDQRQAQRELEAARAELERILRQLREEEMERLLARLASRFREMLAAQQSINDDTTSIHQQVLNSASRNLMLSAIRLSRREAELVRDAEKALTLLREDGTSVAFPETVEQIAEDMRTVTTRLAAADVGPITQTVELDIVAGLEDMIAALDRARDELAQQQSQSQPQQASGGAPQEMPLVPPVSELRMIRTLQARINARTENLGNLADNPQVDPADLAEQLDELAERQKRVFEATRDLATGANR